MPSEANPPHPRAAASPEAASEAASSAAAPPQPAEEIRGERPRPHPMMENDAASAWLGLEVVDHGPGRATCTMVLRPEMLNGFGIGHGGMVFALADTAFALACNDPDATDTITVASGVDINYIAPALPGLTLTAVAAERARAGRSGVCDITVTQEREDGEPVTVAEFRGRSRTIPRR